MKALKHQLMLKDPKLSTSNKGGGRILLFYGYFSAFAFVGNKMMMMMMMNEKLAKC